MTFPRHTGSRGEPPAPCPVYGVVTHLEICWPRTCWAVVNTWYRQEITGLMMRLLSWKDGTKDCRKSSSLPSRSVSMVLASRRDRVDSFAHQRHKEGHCRQLPNREQSLGRPGSGGRPRDSHPLGELHSTRDSSAHTEKGSRLQSTIGFRADTVKHWPLQHILSAEQHQRSSQLIALMKTRMPQSLQLHPNCH